MYWLSEHGEDLMEGQQQKIEFWGVPITIDNR